MAYGPDWPYFNQKQKNNITKFWPTGFFKSIIFSFLKKKEIKHNKHINNQNQETFIAIIINYTFRIFLLRLLCKRIFFKKYWPYKSNNIVFILPTNWPYFFCCLYRRPKKLNWFHLSTVSGTNFVYSFSFLRNWSTQSYPAIFACFRIASLIS